MIDRKDTHVALLSSVRGVIEGLNMDQLEYFFISVGVNDIDTHKPDNIAEEYKDIISLLKEKYPEIKIIASEITPRNDDKDKDVITCNKLLGDICKSMENMYLVDHSNISDSTYSLLFDERHIHKKAIGLFVSNIKKGLRKAYGQPPPPPPPHQRDIIVKSKRVDTWVPQLQRNKGVQKLNKLLR